MCRESLPPDTSTKARFAGEQAPFRGTELFIRVTLSWADHPDVWVETHSRLRTLSFAAMTNEEKKCHNSLLDIMTHDTLIQSGFSCPLRLTSGVASVQGELWQT